MALYVYGIMRTSDAARAVAGSRQAGHRPIDEVEYEGVSALVSVIPDEELRLRRDNILAHSDVLQAAFAEGPVLPFRFGAAIADEESVVREVLTPSAERLSGRLRALVGKAEMQVKATYAEEPLVRSILAQDPALARMAQRIQGMPAEATHFERIRIGEAIAGAVQSRRAANEQALAGALAPLAVANVVSPSHHERGVLNAAFLVDRSELPRFDEALEAVSEQTAPQIEFKLIGPLPPYSFADRDWVTDGSKEVGA